MPDGGVKVKRNSAGALVRCGPHAFEAGELGLVVVVFVLAGGCAARGGSAGVASPPGGGATAPDAWAESAASGVLNRLAAGIVLADDENGSEAFSRPLQFSVVNLIKDDSGVRIRAVVARPETDEEKAEVNDAVGWAAAFVNGKAPGVQVEGGLAVFARSQVGRADTPAAVVAHGLRFENAQVRGELRRVGHMLVLVERPVGANGMMVTLLATELNIKAPE